MSKLIWSDNIGRVDGGTYAGRALRRYRDGVYDAEKKDFAPGWKIDILIDGGWNVVTGCKTESDAIAAAEFMLCGEPALATDEELFAAGVLVRKPDLLHVLENLLAEFDAYDRAMSEIGRGHEDYGQQRATARAAILRAKKGQ